MKFIIQGGKKLEGEIEVNGFKNAATPIIAATLLTKATCVLENIPRIGDVLKMLEILQSCGSEIKWLDSHTLEIKNRELDPSAINQKLIKKIRSSILLVGPMLARFKKFRFAFPGGCQIGPRPIDVHLDALKQLGAEISFDKNSELYEIVLNGPKTNKVYLKEASVTATENLLMLGSVYPLEIRLAACEPHVQDLGNFLTKIIGTRIDGLGTYAIITHKSAGDVPGPIRYRVINDLIEAGTFAILAAATKSNLKIKGVNVNYLDSVLAKLKEFGVIFKHHDSVLEVNGSVSVLQAAMVQTLPYPGLSTDLQAPFGVLATQAAGQTKIFDTMYQNRLGYIQELKKMGADAEILDSHQAVINGPTELHGAEIESLDLRAGATLVIAALTAKGKSVIGNIEQIDRGYEKLDERLQKIGAEIRRIN